MRETIHLLASLLLILILYPYLGAAGFIILISGVLIDIDHWLYAFARFGIAHPGKVIKFYTRKRSGYFWVVHAFHTIEFFALSAVFAYINYYARIFFIGLVLHYSLDFINQRTTSSKIRRNNSLIIRIKNWF